MTIPLEVTASEKEKVIKLPFKPTDPQQKFIHCPDQQAAMVAGVGSGKTVALCMRAWAISYKYPGNRGILARYAYDEIRDALIPTWRTCIPTELMINPDVLDRKDLASQVLLLHSSDPERPSEVLFRNLDDPHKFESIELGWAGISQANDPKITLRMWQYLNERLRWPVPYHFAFLEANYGGNASKGGWIHQWFKDEKRGTLFEADTLSNWENLPDDYKAIIASMPEYRKKHSIYSTEESWDPLIDIRGIPVYPEFKFGFHVPVDAEIGDIRKRVVRERPVVRGIDVPGPGACVWVQMDERGRLLVAHELVMDEAIGTSEFADIVQSESAAYFPGCKFVDYVDPAAMRVEQTSGMSNHQVLYQHGIRARLAPTQIDKRLQAVKDWLTMAVRGEAGLVIDPECHRLVGGFQGGYYLAQVGSGSGVYRPLPLKNTYSHVHDALQYACSGVVRLQYASSRDDEPLPMPAYTLGSLHRTLRTPKRPTSKITRANDLP